jgi:hypothetical protein
MNKNHYSPVYGKCEILEGYEIAKNPAIHDMKQEDIFMIMTDDNGHYYARVNKDNDGADNY